MEMLFIYIKKLYIVIKSKQTIGGAEVLKECGFVEAITRFFIE